MGQRSEWVIHIWGKKRDVLELTSVERFHLDMLKKFQKQQKEFDKILINIALDDNDRRVFDFLKSELEKVLVNENIEIVSCENNPLYGEYVTFKPYVFDRMGEDVSIFYTHFKGYRSYIQPSLETFPTRVFDLCEMYWSYIMYRYSLNISDVRKRLKSKSVYCWYLLDVDEDKLDNTLDSYYIGYQKKLYECCPELEKYNEEKKAKHSPGSFAWYNMKRIGDLLENKREIVEIGNVLTSESNLFTHFCELFLLPFIPEDEIYTPNSDKKEWVKYKNKLYDTIYPLKKIGREFLKDFDKYLIENGLI